MRPRSAWASVGVAMPLVVLLALPLLALAIDTSPGRFLASMSSPLVREALGLSIATTLFSTAVVVLLGTPLAWWLARSRGRARGILLVLVDLPLILPPAVAGIGLLMAFGSEGLLGGIIGDVVFTPTAVVLAQIFVAAPLFVGPAKTALESVHETWLDLAAIDGASSLQTWRHLILPVARSGLAAGTVAAMGRALGEFGATLIFAGNFTGSTQTLPLVIYTLIESSELGAANDVALLLVVVGIALQLTLLRQRSGDFAPPGTYKNHT